MEDVDDPTDFTDARLQKLDHDFRCAICKELYTTPVQLTTCVHSFCAVCIRRRLGQERHCPTCRTPADETKLIRNSVLDDLVNNWRSAARQIVIAFQNNQTSTIAQSGSKAERLGETMPQETSTGARRSRRIMEKHQDQPDIPDLSIEPLKPRPLPSPAVQGIPLAPPTAQTTTASSAPQASSNDPEFIDLTQESFVSCPICQQKMRQAVVNQHLDRCMRGDSSYIPSSNASSSRLSSTFGLAQFQRQRQLTSQQSDQYGKKPVKQVYDMLKDKDLRKILRDLNLPDLGDRQLLVWRHREYVTLYHANMDAAQPVSGSVLIRRLQDAENAHLNNQNREQRATSDLDEHNQKYKDEFARMIEETRKRRRQNVPTPSAETISSESPEGKNKTVGDKTHN